MQHLTGLFLTILSFMPCRFFKKLYCLICTSFMTIGYLLIYVRIEANLLVHSNSLYIWSAIVLWVLCFYHKVAFNLRRRRRATFFHHRLTDCNTPTPIRTFDSVYWTRHWLRGDCDAWKSTSSAGVERWTKLVLPPTGLSNW